MPPSAMIKMLAGRCWSAAAARISLLMQAAEWVTGNARHIHIRLARCVRRRAPGGNGLTRHDGFIRQTMPRPGLFRPVARRTAQRWRVRMAWPG